ncbi:hypothetical protein K469DRAFT_771970 [Zopfia rhizophila CBS 207.26]|uniref:Uncharacterized protein n=1 Tax=Zopfia rhizophila CBS 207.26 TaxID=1314779 RepID=A0A6A6E668_9PEZI|nr:hypothetical protein K469DRAFT_771970 [Zopfia rhizophila CBS 207.26]
MVTLMKLDRTSSEIENYLAAEKLWTTTYTSAGSMEKYTDQFTNTWNEIQRRQISLDFLVRALLVNHLGPCYTGFQQRKREIGIEKLSYFDTIRKLSRSPNTIGELDILSAKILVDFTSNIFRKDSGGKIFKPTLSLEYLVSTLSAFKCSDPRDTVFAFRNIAREVEGQHANQPPIPDYEKDLLEVYIDFVRWVFKTSKSLDIICRHWALPGRKEENSNHHYIYDKLLSWIQLIQPKKWYQWIETWSQRLLDKLDDEETAGWSGSSFA